VLAPPVLAPPVLAPPVLAPPALAPPDDVAPPPPSESSFVVVDEQAPMARASERDGSVRAERERVLGETKCIRAS
jgi:hypothetical protein